MPASTHTPSSGHLHSCSSSFPPSLSLHSSTFPGFKQHTPDLGVKSGSFLFLRDDSDLDVQLDKASASRDLLAYQNHALMVEKTQLIEVNTRLITEHVEDQQRIEDLEKQRAQWKTENHELSDEGEELKKCNMSLEGEKERLQSELSRLQSSQQHFSDLSAKLEADCTASKLEIKKLTSDHNATFFQNQQLKKKNHILDQNCVRLRAELEAMEQKAAILLSKHTQETDKAKEDIRYLHSTNTRLQSQHKDAVLSHQNCYKLHVQLRKLQAHIQAKEAEASQLKQEGKESRDDLAHALDKLKWRQDQWDEKHSAFQERVTDLMYEVSVARSAHADCDDKICRLEGQLKARQIELKSKASLLGTKSEQLLRLQGLYDTLIQDYENVTDKYTHLR